VTLVVLLGATALVLLPFVGGGLLAAVFVIATWPMYLRLRAGLNGREGLAAGLMTLLTLVMVVAPLAWLIETVVRYVPALIDTARGWVKNGLPGPPAIVASIPLLGEMLAAQWTRIASDPGALRQIGGRIAEIVRDPLLSGGRIVGNGLIQLSLATFLAFFLWRDGDRLAARSLAGLTRIAGPMAAEMLELVHTTVRAVMIGFIGTGLAQGVVAAIGFLIAGVPGAALLGVATALLSILPSGTVPVWVGAAIWLAIDGQVGWALFVAAWGALLVSTIDNVLRPILISRTVSLSFLPVFLGVIGGVIAYGFVGLFIGPTLLAVTFRLWQRWVSDAPRVFAGTSTTLVPPG
jgi:predicted PurR-regulated permease PerM